MFSQGIKLSQWKSVFKTFMWCCFFSGLLVHILSFSGKMKLPWILVSKLINSSGDQRSISPTVNPGLNFFFAAKWWISTTYSFPGHDKLPYYQIPRVLINAVLSKLKLCLIYTEGSFGSSVWRWVMGPLTHFFFLCVELLFLNVHILGQTTIISYT